MFKTALALLAALILSGCANQQSPKLWRVEDQQMCVTVSMLPPSEVQDLCGHDGIVFGCYVPWSKHIIAPLPSNALDREAWHVLGHEVGHHLYGRFHD